MTDADTHDPPLDHLHPEEPSARAPHRLTALLAAAEIRDDFRKGVKPYHLPPEVLHRIRFVREVCAELDLDETPDNLHAVDEALRAHGVEPDLDNEYPKYLRQDGDVAVIAESPEHEAELNRPAAEPVPEPVDAEG